MLKTLVEIAPETDFSYQGLYALKLKHANFPKPKGKKQRNNQFYASFDTDAVLTWCKEHKALPHKLRNKNTFVGAIGIDNELATNWLRRPFLSVAENG